MRTGYIAVTSGHNYYRSFKEFCRAVGEMGTAHTRQMARNELYNSGRTQWFGHVVVRA